MKGRKLLLLPAMLLASSGLSSCSVLCTVTWLNWDGEILEVDKHVFPFEFLKYDGETPTREKDAQFTYEFAGWEPIKASSYFPKRVVKRETVYKATYAETIRSYKITFKDNFGTVFDSQFYNYGELPHFDAPLIRQTTENNFEFLKWDKPFANVTGEATYTAYYNRTVRPYNVTWLDGNGDVIRVDSVPYNATPSFGSVDPVLEPDALHKDEYCYNFVGWQNTSSGSMGVKPVKGDVTYRAVYEQHFYKYFDMTYSFYNSEESKWENYVGDEVKDILCVREHTDLVLPEIIEGSNVEWYLTPNYEKRVFTAEDVYDSMDFYGRKVGLHNYEVTYDLDGGSLPSTVSNPKTVTCEDEVTLNNPIKEGYEFVGWYNGDEKVEKLENIYSDIHLVAMYTANEHKITYVFSGKEPSTVTVKFDEDIVFPEDEKVGYEFLGWKEEGATEFFASPMKADYDVTLYPVFKAIDYPITYILGSGVTCDTTGHETYNIENKDEILPEPQKTGYEFEGWELLSPHVEGVYQSLGEVTDLELGPVTISPVFTPLPINVGFDFNGGTKEFLVSFKDGTKLLNEETVAYEVNEVNYFVAKDKDNYQFAGWYNWPQSEIAADLTLQAKWNEIGTTPSGDRYATIKVGDEKNFTLHNLNGQYCQFTSLVNQKIKILSTGQLDLVMISKEDLEEFESGITTGDPLNYYMTFKVEAGKTYKFKVQGATNTDGYTTVKLERTDGEGQVPTDTIKAALVNTHPDISSKYDAALPTLIAPVRNGYKFDGWYYGDKKYESGDLIKETQDFILQAHWTAIEE